MKRKRAALAALLVLTLALTGCAGTDKTATEGATAQTEKGTVTQIDAATAHERMSASDDYILLDVRTAEEYAEAHIEGAVLLTDSNIEAQAAEVLPDKNKVIYVYCRSGRRSAASSALLAEMGYTNVFDMGGIVNWTYGTVSGGD
jgi:rhodanese-related sulfurtransferase